jgi:hypothetical protein
LGRLTIGANWTGAFEGGRSGCFNALSVGDGRILDTGPDGTVLSRASIGDRDLNTSLVIRRFCSVKTGCVCTWTATRWVTSTTLTTAKTGTGGFAGTRSKGIGRTTQSSKLRDEVVDESGPIVSLKDVWIVVRINVSRSTSQDVQVLRGQTESSIPTSTYVAVVTAIVLCKINTTALFTLNDLRGGRVTSGIKGETNTNGDESKGTLLYRTTDNTQPLVVPSSDVIHVLDKLGGTVITVG